MITVTTIKYLSKKIFLILSLILTLISLIVFVMFFSLVTLEESFCSGVLKLLDLSPPAYDYFSFLLYAYNILINIYFKCFHLFENFLFECSNNTLFAVLFTIKIITLLIMIVNFFNDKSTCFTLSLKNIRFYIRYILNNKKKYACVFIFTYLTVLLYRSLYIGLTDLKADLNICQQFDMLLSTYLLINLSVYNLHRIILAEKLDNNKSILRVYFYNSLQNITFIHLLYLLMVYFIFINYVTPFYFNILYLLPYYFIEGFIRTAENLLSLHSGLKPLNIIFKSLSRPCSISNKSFIYTHELALSNSSVKLGFRIKASFLLRDCIYLNNHCLNNMQVKYVHSNILKEVLNKPTINVSLSNILSTLSGTKIFTLSYVKGSTKLTYFLEGKISNMSTFTNIFNMCSNNHIYKSINNNMNYYCIIDNSCIINNTKDILDAFYNKNVLAVFKVINNIGLYSNINSVSNIECYAKNNLSCDYKRLLDCNSNTIIQTSCSNYDK